MPTKASLAGWSSHSSLGPLLQSSFYDFRKTRSHPEEQPLGGLSPTLGKPLQPDTSPLSSLNLKKKKNSKMVNNSRDKLTYINCLIRHFIFSFLAAPTHMEFPGQGSDPSHSHDLSKLQLQLPGSLIHCVQVLPRCYQSCCITVGTLGATVFFF